MPKFKGNKGSATPFRMLAVFLSMATGCWASPEERVRDAALDSDLVQSDVVTIPDAILSDRPDAVASSEAGDVLTDIADAIATDADASMEVGALDASDGFVVDRADVGREDVPILSDVVDIPDTGSDTGVVVDVPPTQDVTCPQGQTVCAGSCIDLQTTAIHCGRCSGACPMGAPCMAGRCRLTLTANRMQGFWTEDAPSSWRNIWSQTTTGLPLGSSPLCVGSFGYTSGGTGGYNNTRLGLVFPQIPVPASQVRRAYLILTRSGHRDDPPQFVNVVRGPCGMLGWSRTDYDRVHWGSESFGERAASEFPLGIARTLPDLSTSEGANGLRLRDGDGRTLLSDTGENCIGLRTRDDLVDLVSTPSFSPVFRSITGPNTALAISTNPQLVVEIAP